MKLKVVNEDLNDNRKILNEDEFDTYSDQDVGFSGDSTGNETGAPTSSDMLKQTTIVDGDKWNNPDNIDEQSKLKMLENKWRNAQTNANAKSKAVEWYFENVIKCKNGSLDLFTNKTNIVTVMSAIFSSYGFTRNPFTDFFKMFKTKINDTKLKVSDLVVLYNLRSDRVLEDRDLMCLSNEKDRHLIFQDNLYKQPSKDVKFIVQCYSWLSKPTNIQNYIHAKEVDFTTILYSLGIPGTEVVKRGAGKFVVSELNGANLIRFRDAIIYKNEYSTVRLADEIERILNYIEKPESTSMSSADYYARELTDEDGNTRKVSLPKYNGKEQKAIFDKTGIKDVNGILQQAAFLLDYANKLKGGNSGNTGNTR